MNIVLLNYEKLFTTETDVDSIINNPIEKLFKTEVVDDMASNSVVTKGERVPIAVKVFPSDENFDNFDIDLANTEIRIRNVLGSVVATVPDTAGLIVDAGQLSLDNDNHTVIFSWNTANFDTSQYTIIFWITVNYNGNTFRIASDFISKSIRLETLIR
jgi:hypothetical protein